METLEYKYKYKNIVIIILYFLIMIFVILIILYSINLRSNSNKEKYSSFVQFNTNKFNLSINLSRNSAKNIENSEVAKDWIRAESIGDNFFYQYMISKFIREDINVASGIEYSLGVIKFNDNGEIYTVTSNSTEDINFIIDNELQLKREEVKNIWNVLSNTGEYTISYDETYNRDYFIKLYYSRFNNNNMVIYTLIPYNLLTVGDNEGDWFLTVDDKLIGTNNYDSLNDYVKYIVNGESNLNLIHISEDIEYLMKYNFFNKNLNYTALLGVLFFCISILIGGYFVLKKISTIIYKPLDALIYNFEITDKNHIIDEIKLFEESVNKVNILNESIKNIREDISEKTKENTYFRLVMGFNEKVNYDGNFFVSLFKFDYYTKSEDKYYLQNKLQAYASDNNSIIFVKLDNDVILFILKYNDYNLAYNTVTNILYDYLDDVDVKVSLTNKYNDFNNLKTAYSSAEKILEYCYYFPDKDILSSEDLQYIDLEEYNFSLQVENKIIYLALKGDDEALNLYDEFIRLNISDTSLTNLMLENYILALINMINRIFSELKIQPNKFIGYEISYFDWINKRNDANIIYDIRKVISQIVTIQKEKRNYKNIDEENNIIEYIHKNYMQDIMLNDICSEFQIRPQIASEIFKRNTNMSFKSYLNNYRIIKAQEIQKKNTSIKTAELAEIVGFNSSTSFIRVYKKIVGVSPQEFQKNIK